MPLHDTIQHLQQVMGHGGEQAFNTVPFILEKVLRKKLWLERLDQNGKPFPSFEAFVAYKLWWGLESSVDDLRAFCRKHPEVIAMIDGAIEPHLGYGGDRRSENFQVDTVNSKTRGGNSASYRRKRLKRDRSDLYDKYLAGELTLIAAEVEAGIRQKTFTIPDDLHAAAKALARHFGPAHALALADYIEQEVRRDEISEVTH